MRVYEELFIIKPDTPEEEVDGIVTQIQGVITNGKGTVDKTDKWGTRKLAYRVQKYAEGIYVLIQFSSSPDLRCSFESWSIRKATPRVNYSSISVGLPLP